MKEKKEPINKNKKKKSNINIEKTDIIIFSIVFLIFGIALLSFFPAILTSDCVDQIAQAKANVYSSSHPIFHSFLIGNLAKLGGVWVPALFQILVFATIWTYCCKTLRKYNNCFSNRMFQYFATIVVSIIPLNFLYAITLWKDILYSYSILILLMLIYIGIKEKYKYSKMQLAFIAISSVSIMKFRYNGVPIGLLMFAFLLIMNLVKTKKIKNTIILMGAFIATFIIMTIPQWLWQVKTASSGGSVLNGTKVYCMGALLNTDIQLENDEIEFLNSILDVEKWREGYNPYSAASIVYNSDFNNNILTTVENNKKMDEIFIKYVKQKPYTVLKHFLSVNSIWWSIPELGGMHSIVLSNSWISDMSGGIYDNHPIIKNGDEFIINTIVNKTMETSFRYELFYRPATAILISLIMIIAVCVKKKNGSYLIILIPMILNIGTYVFLIASQDQRYFYPCFMTEYLSILIFWAEFMENKKCVNNKENKIENKKKNPKTLVIIPAYNESESIEKVVNNVYQEQIPNCNVIVVNDGSNDNTYEQAKKTKAIVIDSPNNLGIGGAVQTGYLYAKKNHYDIAIQLDGDGQHDTQYLKKMIEEVNAGCDLVIGSRFVEKSNYKQTLLRMFGIKIISYEIKAITGKQIYDTTSGYRACNKKIIEEFSKSYPYDYPEPCTNMQMIRKGYDVKEIPVIMKKRETGISSISPLKSVSYMFKVTLSILLMGFKE